MTLGKLEKLLERDDIPEDAKLIISNEITAQKEVNKSRSEDFKLLKKAENRYRTLMENSIQAYTVIQNNQIVFANSAIENLLGYTKKELLAFSINDFSELIHPDDKELVLTRIQDRLKGKTTPSRYECRLIDKKGVIHQVELLSSAIEINGQPAIQTTSIDITQQKKIEDELIGEKEFIENALNALEDTFFVFDVGTGKPIRWNQAFIRITGYSDMEIQNMTPADFYESDDLENMERTIKEVLKNGSGLVNASIVTKTGKRIPYEYIGVLLKDSIKKTTCICAIGRNISERIFMEDEIKKSEAKYSSILRAAPIGIGVLHDRTFKYVSDFFLDIVGYSRDELIGQNSKMLYSTKEEYERVGKKIYQDMEEFGIGTYEFQIKRKDSKIIDVHVRVTHTDLIDLSAGITFTILDITESKEVEEMYRELFNSMKSGVAVYKVKNGGEDFIFQDFNQAGERIDNISKEELIGKSVLKKFPSVREFGLFDVFQRVWKTGIPERYPISLYEDQNITGWRENYVYKLPSGEIVAVYDDITKRKQEEEELLLTKARLEFLLTSSPAAIFSAEPEDVFRIKFISKNIKDITGYDSQEFINDPKFIDNLIHPEDVERVITKLNEISGEETYQDIYRLKHKDGSYRSILEEAKQIIDEQGIVIDRIGYVTDITKHMQTEDALRESERYLKEAQTIAQIGYWKLDSETEEVTGSDELFRIFELNGDETSYVKFVEMIHPEDIEDDLFQIRRGMEQGIPWDSELRLLCKGGNVKYIQVKGEAITDKSKKVIYLIGTVQDITERKRIEKALQESEERFRTFFYSATDAIDLWDSDLNLIDCNQVVIDNFLIKPEKEALIGKNITEIIPDVKKTGRYDKYIDTLKTGKPYHLESFVSHPKFGNKVFSVQAIKVGKELGMITRDITEQKNAERLLQESERKYRLFFESAPIGIGISDLNSRVIAYNEKILEITGFKTDEIRKIKIADTFVNPNDRKKLLQTIQDTGYASDFEVQLKRKDGTPYYCLLNLNTMELEGKKVFLTTQLDLTKQKKSEEALRLSEEKYRLIVETAQEGVWLNDNEAKITFANQRLAKMLGYSVDNLIGHSIFEFLDPEMKSKAELYLKQDKVCLKEKFDFKFYKRDGMEFWGLVSTNQILNPSGDIISTLGMVIDITERKKREEETKKQLMKYNVEEGNLYLIAESSPNFSINVIKDLFRFGYPVLIISRTLERDIRKTFTGEYEFLWFAQESNEKSILPKFEEIEFKIRNLTRKSVILLDRIDYLVQKSSFKDVLNFIYNLKEIVYFLDSIVIISVDSKSLTDREFLLLQKETKEIQSRFITGISEENLQILRIIFQKNNTGIKPSYSEIGKEFNMSRPTTRKKIKTLVTAGYINEQRFGNRKILDVTQRGRSLFEQ